MRGLGSWRPPILGALVLACWFGWQWLRPQAAAQEPAAGNEAAAASSATAAPGSGGPGGTAPSGGSAQAARERQLQLWERRYERAEQVYQSYLQATRHPPHSRPLAEHPDQQRPFDPVVEEVAPRDGSGRPVAGVRIRSSQDRVHVTGAESARFTLEAMDAQGRRVPLAIRRSAAQAMPDTTALTSVVRVDLPFTDDGAGADDVAGDGRYAARLTPSAQGFAGRAGTIRVLAEFVVNGEQGTIAFDIVYVPEVPGTWSGVREALEGGALNFYLQAQVTRPGRYVASARVHDANGAPIALLQFNDVVPAGAVEFKLSLTGLLVREQRPAFPLRLVDVEAFLLKPDTYPDRAMMPRLPGQVHVSRSYGLDGFSAEEWQGEERERHLAEYLRDVMRAEDALWRLRR